MIWNPISFNSNISVESTQFRNCLGTSNKIVEIFTLILQNWNENSSNFEIDWTFKSRNETDLEDGLKELSISIICFISQKRFCLKTKTIKRIYSVIISLIVNNHNIFLNYAYVLVVSRISPFHLQKPYKSLERMSAKLSFQIRWATNFKSSECLLFCAFKFVSCSRIRSKQENIVSTSKTKE